MALSHYIAGHTLPTEHAMFSTWALRLASLWLLVALAHSAGAAEVGHLERIRDNGRLRVCIWPDYYGISYRNPKTGTLTGIDIEMAHALASDLGVEVAFVDSAFSRLVEDLDADRCDLAMFAVGITAERQQHLRFTQPYLASDIYAITSKSNRRMSTWADIDQPDTLVAVARGTLHEPVMREKLQRS